MDQMTNFVLNGLFGLLAMIFGWMLKTLWGTVKDLQESDKELNKIDQKADK